MITVNSCKHRMQEDTANPCPPSISFDLVLQGHRRVTFTDQLNDLLRAFGLGKSRTGLEAKAVHCFLP